MRIRPSISPLRSRAGVAARGPAAAAPPSSPGTSRRRSASPSDGNGHLGAEQVRVAVGVEVAEPEQRGARGEQLATAARDAGRCQADADEDRDHGRQADQVHQRPAALQRRHARRYRAHRSAPDREVDGPRAAVRRERASGHRRALRSRSAAARALRSSPRSTSSSSGRDQRGRPPRRCSPRSAGRGSRPRPSGTSG